MLRGNKKGLSETKDFLSNLNKNTRDFQKSVDRALNDSKQKDNVNNSIKEFKASVKRMRDRHSREKTFSSSEVQDVLNRAAKIDTFISRGRLKGDAIKQDWQDVRADLDILARSSYGRGSSYNRRYEPLLAIL